MTTVKPVAWGIKYKREGALGGARVGRENARNLDAQAVEAGDAEVVPLYEHPPADPENETLAERMRREGWRTEGRKRRGVTRTVGGCEWPQDTQVPGLVWDKMRELETPPAVKIARQLHSEGWRTVPGVGAPRLERMLDGLAFGLAVDMGIWAALNALDGSE